ncbi:MAG: cation:proton antiporter [Bacteroidales bacterium]|nr:cation:proton antiporter [Bacteroidales bacterium]
MSALVILTICVLLLIAYLFDLSASKTKIPSVVLLLILGWGVRQITQFSGISLPDLTPILPGLGTIGLVLIVLEGSLELELKKSKIAIVRKSFTGALLSMMVLAFAIAFILFKFKGYPFEQSLINAIPFSVISSAIAIPSVRSSAESIRESVVYESSLSDILGVLFFNFMTINAVIDLSAFGNFGLQILVMFVISLATTVALSLFLSKVEHHIRFIPIILVILLVYEISHELKLPSLIFIMIFGLFLGNLDKLSRYKWAQYFRPDVLDKEINKFKEFVFEISFLVRALFFMLFGYLIKTSDIFDLHSLTWAIIIVSLIFLIRAIQLKISSQPLRPLLFIAPRGLITILLVLSIPASQQIPLINYSLMIQVVVLTSIIMMVGLMFSSVKKQ